VRLLVIGGTSFVGRHLVARALAAGHEMTLFNRGVTNPGLFSEAEHLRGDRDGGLEPLEGRRWDAVVDTCGYVPRVVGDSARMLAGAVERYLFVSTLSVHPDDVEPGADEDAPLLDPPAHDVEEVTEETYGPLKVASERAVVAALPDRALIVRPGLIVGPDDPTDRFTYWVRRVDAGGEILAPAPPEYRVQFIDVRDLAAFLLLHLEAGTAGVFSAVAPPVPLGDLLEACRSASGSDGSLTWVPEPFLRQHGVEPWDDLPMWLPELAGVNAFDPARAMAAGLAPRASDETVRDTLVWDRARPQRWPMRAGLDPDREREVLAAFHGATDPGS
jgi:nucleoside-diphosphate-sugar epimerase